MSGARFVVIGESLIKRTLSSPGSDRAIQYSRDSSDRTDKPRRTGYPAFAGYDGEHDWRAAGAIASASTYSRAN